LRGSGRWRGGAYIDAAGRMFWRRRPVVVLGKDAGFATGTGAAWHVRFLLCLCGQVAVEPKSPCNFFFLKRRNKRNHRAIGGG
jgi:hypothetical protein